ncbi:MAG TPA: dienelactone hydrolase family protein [Opitutaceae bacterium]|nr:dienelactone hydrolase family protein [Opitutaceae bacterium]
MKPPHLRLVRALLLIASAAAAGAQSPVPGTALLTGDVNRSEEMRAGIEGYLDRELARAVAHRGELWRRNLSSPQAYTESGAANRARLEKMIGAVEPRVASPDLQYIETSARGAKLAESDKFVVRTVRWPVYDDVDAEGLLLTPKGRIFARVVAVPDADQTPEMIASSFGGRLAENGCEVLVPALVSRESTFSGSAALKRFTNQPHREWIYRQAYTFGRHIIGYEVHHVLAAVDWFARQTPRSKIGVAGWGEGGLLALHAAALDPRIEAALVSGYFGPREKLWAEPIYRNVFGLLREFGDAELASLIAPRRLVIEAAPAPQISGPPAPTAGTRPSAATGRIVTPHATDVQAEVERAQKICGPFGNSISLSVQSSAMADPSLLTFLQSLAPSIASLAPPASLAPLAALDRQRTLVTQLERHTQRLIEHSRGVRDEAFWKPLRATTPAAWNEAVQPWREKFWNDIIGRLPRTDTPLNARSRLLFERDDAMGYEVVLDVLPDVTLWGYLLLPKNLAAGERRPVVVAQHGLSGVPADLINEDPAARANRVYHAFALQLVRRGYVVFVPHFPWRTDEDYRRLQRKAHPLGLSLFSFILAHHDRLLDWLGQQPWTDASRIGLYGLSWGGKVALRVPALLPRYALSICSGDFNEWIWKNATTDWGSSYLFAPEPEMFDFNLGMTSGHAEMAAMIAPRAFMVERGHDDGVGLDEWVAFEYARVRRLYARLGIGDRTEIEFFSGVHEIHAVGTFHFLQRQFNWPPSPPAPDRTR